MKAKTLRSEQILWSGAAAKAKVQGLLGSSATENAQPQAGASARRPFRLKVGPKWLRPAVTHRNVPCTQQQAENGMPRVLMQCSGFFTHGFKRKQHEANQKISGRV